MARVWDDIARKRISRRRALAGGAALGAAGATLVACGGSGGGNANPTGEPVAEGTPTKGGIYRIRQPGNSNFPSLSPFGPTALISTLVFGFTTYDHLWYVPIDTGQNELMLASDLEIVDEQGLQVNVTMHEAFFHDKPPVSGRQVLASDVKASWEAFRDDPFGLGREWLKDIVESLEAPEDRLFVIKQKRPWAWMFGTAGAGSPASSSVLPAETIDGTQFDLANDVAGSGRLFLESHRGGANLKFRAFPNWRVPGEPFLGGVDFILIPDYSSAEAQFAAGEIDSFTFQNKLQADQMQDRLGDDITVTTELSRAYHCLMIKQIPPFDDERVRRAIRLATNREEMIQLVERDVAGGVNCGIVPPAQRLYALPEDDPDMVEYFRYDPDQARSLLEDADFPFDDEFPLLISSPNEELSDRAQVMKDQLSRVGVKVRIEAQDLLSVWVPRVLIQADYTMTLFTHLAYEDPYLPLAFYTTFSPIGPRDEAKGRNSMLFYDQEIDDAVDASSLELDLDARIEKVQAAQRLIMRKESPMINLYSSVSFNARWHWLKGVVEGRGSFGLFNGRSWIDSALRGS
jgi:peptide/nickel transport system substrate-binding protein